MSEYTGDGHTRFFDHGSFWRTDKGWWPMLQVTPHYFLRRDEVISVNQGGENYTWWETLDSAVIAESQTKIEDRFWLDVFWPEHGFFDSTNMPVLFGGEAPRAGESVPAGITAQIALGSSSEPWISEGGRTGDGSISFLGEATVVVDYPFCYGWMPTYGFWSNRLGFWWSPNAQPYQQWKDFS